MAVVSFLIRIVYHFVVLGVEFGFDQVAGVLRCLVALLKAVSRDSACGYLSRIFEMLPPALLDSSSTTLRLLSVKLQQRIAIGFLPARLASWRYQRGRMRTAPTRSPQSAANTRRPALFDP
jgi:hypothetical protein